MREYVSATAKNAFNQFVVNAEPSPKKVAK